MGWPARRPSGVAPIVLPAWIWRMSVSRQGRMMISSAVPAGWPPRSRPVRIVQQAHSMPVSAVVVLTDLGAFRQAWRSGSGRSGSGHRLTAHDPAHGSCPDAENCEIAQRSAARSSESDTAQRRAENQLLYSAQRIRSRSQRAERAGQRDIRHSPDAQERAPLDRAIQEAIIHAQEARAPSPASVPRGAKPITFGL